MGSPESALNFDDLFDPKDKQKAPKKSPIEEKWEAARKDGGSKIHEAIIDVLDK